MLSPTFYSFWLRFIGNSYYKSSILDNALKLGIRTANLHSSIREVHKELFE